MNALRYASTSAVSAGKHKVVVVGAGSGGLAVANQLYNSFRANGKELGKGDVAVIDVLAEEACVEFSLFFHDDMGFTVTITFSSRVP
ncbi:hypothetical protein QFC21_006928 [Naganishia friedmannii]|uniref:Uncharacterized protein n=1 Tax=Naganishia friedmannii TaxID=89922 RepID=A0ACC2UYN7_9TREE|nr:hypothetical protein QFC21_006928 [Naganishia friedmannii]